ncbi:hypothetical protein IJX73_02450 [bacterium]|nr:hypothetical protein [bacterium]MBQ9149770.1 hypothetical protein [bacterium]
MIKISDFAKGITNQNDISTNTSQGNTASIFNGSTYDSLFDENGQLDNKWVLQDGDFYSYSNITDDGNITTTNYSNLWFLNESEKALLKFNDNKDWQQWTKYEYADDGKLKSQTIYDRWGNAREHEYYEYSDDDGFADTQYTDFNADGQYDEITKFLKEDDSCFLGYVENSSNMDGIFDKRGIQKYSFNENPTYEEMLKNFEEN